MVHNKGNLCICAGFCFGLTSLHYKHGYPMDLCYNKTAKGGVRYGICGINGR